MVCPHHHDSCLSTLIRVLVAWLWLFNNQHLLHVITWSWPFGGPKSCPATYNHSSEEVRLRHSHPVRKSRRRISCIFDDHLYPSEYTWWPMYHLNFPKSFISPFIDFLRWEQYLLKSFLPTNPTKVNLSSTNSRWSDHSISFPKPSLYVSFSQLLSATWTLSLMFSCRQIPLIRKFPSLSIWRDWLVQKTTGTSCSYP